MSFVELLKKSVTELLEGGHTALAQETLNMAAKGLGLYRGEGVIKADRSSTVYGHTEGPHKGVTASKCGCSQKRSMENCKAQGLPVLDSCGHICAHRLRTGSLTEQQVTALMGWAEEQPGLKSPGSKMLDKSTEFQGYVLEARAKKAEAQAARRVNIVRLQCKNGSTIGGKPHHDMVLDVSKDKLPAVWLAAKAKFPQIKGISQLAVTQTDANNLAKVSEGLKL